MEENKSKVTKEEVDIKLPIVFSFVVLVFCVVLGFSEEKFRYWGIEEEIISSGEIGILAIVSSHIAFLIILLVFVRYSYSSIIHWVAIFLVFGVVGIYLFNNGSCITEKGLYEREYGRTVHYSFEEIDSYKVEKSEEVGQKEVPTYKVYMKNGKVFSFHQVKEQTLIKIHHTIGMAEKKNNRQ